LTLCFRTVYGEHHEPAERSDLLADRMSTVQTHTQQPSRRRVATALVLGCLAVGAWSATIDTMSGMEMGGRFSVGSLGFFVVLWVLMMAAMMFPSAWPAVAVYGLVVRRRASVRAHSLMHIVTFVAGYVASWIGFGLGAFGLLAAARAIGLESLSGEELARYVVAPVALAGALYQLAPFKQICLRHCRGPLGFFFEHWREGPRGALAMGSRHGMYCIGCCWMLMLVLLALGVMSVAWMAVVSLAIAIEKLAPARWARPASGVLTTGLAALALVALLKPAWLPAVDGMGDGGGMGDTKPPMG
jgi:predicted metal-binding membrane protein